MAMWYVLLHLDCIFLSLKRWEQKLQKLQQLSEFFTSWDLCRGIVDLVLKLLEQQNHSFHWVKCNFCSLLTLAFLAKESYQTF